MKTNAELHGKAIAIVRTVYGLPVESINGLTNQEVIDTESGSPFIAGTALICYAKALNLSFGDFMEKVNDVFELLCEWNK